MDNFFATIPEPQRSTFLFLRQFLSSEQRLREAWKFHTPFYYHQGKWFAFISYNPQKEHELYIAFVRGSQISHPALLSEGRKVQRIFRVKPDQDIDVDSLRTICRQLKMLY